jgi:hypothetical protein
MVRALIQKLTRMRTLISELQAYQKADSLGQLLLLLAHMDNAHQKKTSTCETVAAIWSKLSKNPQFHHSRTKHIDVRYHLLQESKISVEDKFTIS